MSARRVLEMTKLMRVSAALALLAVIGLAAPGAASAHFSLSIGLPGFAFYAAPCPPPVVYSYPPSYYYYPPPPVVVYESGYDYPYSYSRPGYYRGRGHWKSAYGYRFPGRD
jgi:hypothetical protein